MLSGTTEYRGSTILARSGLGMSHDWMILGLSAAVQKRSCFLVSYSRRDLGLFAFVR